MLLMFLISFYVFLISDFYSPLFIEMMVIVMFALCEGLIWVWGEKIIIIIEKKKRRKEEGKCMFEFNEPHGF